MSKVLKTCILILISSLIGVISCIPNKPSAQDMLSTDMDLALKSIMYYSQHPTDKHIDKFFRQVYIRNDDEYGAMFRIIQLYFEAIDPNKALPIIKEHIKTDDVRILERIHGIMLSISHNDNVFDELIELNIPMLSSGSKLILGRGYFTGLSIGDRADHHNLNRIKALIHDKNKVNGALWILSGVAHNNKNMIDPEYIINNITKITESIDECEEWQVYPRVFLLSKYFENDIFIKYIEKTNGIEKDEILKAVNWLVENRDNFIWNEEKGYFILE